MKKYCFALLLFFCWAFLMGQRTTITDNMVINTGMKLGGSSAITRIVTDGTLAGVTNADLATAAAVKTYVDGLTGGLSSTYFPLSGGTLTGTGGAGFVGFPAQGSTPTAPGAGFRVFANGAGNMGVIRADGYVTTFDFSTATGNRFFTYPANAGTFGILENAQTWTGINTFSNRIVNTVNLNGTATANTLNANFVPTANGQNVTGLKLVSTITSGGFTGGVLNLIDARYSDGAIALLIQEGIVKNMTINSVNTNTVIGGLLSLTGTGGDNSAALVTTSTSGFRVQRNGQGSFRDDSVNDFVLPSAILQLSSTTRGFMMPTPTTAQRDAYSSPADLLMVMNATTKRLNYYNATLGAWVSVPSMASGGIGTGQIVHGDASGNLIGVSGLVFLGNNLTNSAGSVTGVTVSNSNGNPAIGSNGTNMFLGTNQVHKLTMSNSVIRFDHNGQTGYNQINNFVTIGSNTAPTSVFQISPIYSSTGDLSGGGYGFRLVAANYTNTTTAASGTVANAAAASFGSPTIVSTNTGVTYDNFSTVAIHRPIVGTNSTITRNYGLTVYGDANAILAQSTTTANQRGYFGPDFIGLSRLSDGTMNIALRRLGASAGGDAQLTARNTVSLAVDTRTILATFQTGVVIEVASVFDALASSLGTSSVFDVNSSTAMSRPFPRFTGTQLTTTGTWGNLSTVTVGNAGSGYVAGTYTGVAITSTTGNGSGGTATVVVGGDGSVSSVTILIGGARYDVTDQLTVSNTLLGGSGSGFVFSPLLLGAQANGGFVVNSSIQKLYQFNNAFGLDGVVTERMPNAFTNTNTFSRPIGIGTASPNASALVDMVSTVRGLLIPRGTDANIAAVASPALGLQMFSHTSERINVKRTDGFYQLAYVQDLKRDTAYKTVNANLDLSGLTTTFANRYKRVVVETIVTASATGNNTITLPVPSAALLNTKFEISVEDTSGDGDISVLNFGTDGTDGYLYNGDGTYQVTQNLFPGIGVYVSVSWCEAKSAYRWKLQ